jgi:hypothetical protein
MKYTFQTHYRSIVFDNNEEEIESFLKQKGFRKIGGESGNSIGFCISFIQKTFFKCRDFRNPNIPVIYTEEQLLRFYDQYIK